MLRLGLTGGIASGQSAVAGMLRELGFRVLEEMQRQFAEGESRETRGAAFVEAALIIEAGYHKLLDGVVVTWCKPEQQLERLLARGFSAEEARRRIAAQMPVEEKLRYATERIDCSGTLKEIRKQ